MGLYLPPIFTQHALIPCLRNAITWSCIKELSGETTITIIGDVRGIFVAETMEVTEIWYFSHNLLAR